MSKPMTISEAVEKALFRLSLHSDGEAMDICRTLDGKRLCDEAEARDIIQTLLSFASLTPNEYVPQSERARRWLAEHGGE